MTAPSIENTIVDEAHQRTYVILAPRVLTEGEIYRAIRQEILRRGSPLADGETLRLTVTSSGGPIASVAPPQLSQRPLSPAVPNPVEQEPFTSPPAALE